MVVAAAEQRVSCNVTTPSLLCLLIGNNARNSSSGLAETVQQDLVMPGTDQHVPVSISAFCSRLHIDWLTDWVLVVWITKHCIQHQKPGPKVRLIFVILISNNYRVRQKVPPNFFSFHQQSIGISKRDFTDICIPCAHNSIIIIQLAYSILKLSALRWCYLVISAWSKTYAQKPMPVAHKPGCSMSKNFQFTIIERPALPRLKILWGLSQQPLYRRWSLNSRKPCCISDRLTHGPTDKAVKSFHRDHRLVL